MFLNQLEYFMDFFNIHKILRLLREQNIVQFQMPRITVLSAIKNCYSGLG